MKIIAPIIKTARMRQKMSLLKLIFFSFKNPGITPGFPVYDFR